MTPIRDATAGRGRIARWLAVIAVAAGCPVPSHAQSVEEVLRQKTARLKARDPAKEAAAAAARGDARLAGANFIGPMPQGWSLPGVACAMWTRPAIGRWYVADDVIGPGETAHGEAAMRYVTGFNQALVEHPAFPYPELCAREGKRLKPRYPGAVRTYAEAVRSADPAALGRVPAAASIDARDLLGHTALHWALFRIDGEMARLVVERGADVSLRPPTSGGGFDGPAPLAQALRMKNPALVTAMLERGAKFAGSTGLCAERRDPESAFAPECAWLSLTIAAGRADLIERVIRDREATAAAEDAFVVQGETAAAFDRALQAKQEDIVATLLPHLGGDPSSWVDRLIGIGRFDLARRHVTLHPQDLGRSRAESALWAAAADAGREDALLFVANYGGELNLLPAARLSLCRAVAAAGDLDVLAGCVRDAADRRSRIEERVRAGDTAGLMALVREAADPRERRRATIVDLVAAQGSPAMMTALAPLVAPVRFALFGEQRMQPYPDARFPAIAGWAGLAALKARLDTFTNVPGAAIARNDPAMIVALGKLKPTGVAPAFNGYLNQLEPRIAMDPFEDAATETLPDAPGVAAMAVIRPLVALAAAGDGPQSLEEPLRSAVRAGWNDVIRLILAAGFDGKRAKRPDQLWQDWAGLSHACKPSTGALLTGAGVRIDYPLDPRLNGEPPLWIVAAGCKNPASAAVLVRAGADPNTLSSDGDTMVDVAVQRRKPLMAQAFRTLGGVSSDRLPPDRLRERQAARAGVDWDLVPNGETR